MTKQETIVIIRDRIIHFEQQERKLELIEKRTYEQSLQLFQTRNALAAYKLVLEDFQNPKTLQDFVRENLG